MEFKDALRRRRESLGLSPEELARRLTRLGAPTTSADVQLWERGRNTPPLDNPVFQQALANALRTPVESIRRVIRLSERTPDHTAEGERAASLVDTLPDHLRPLALDLLESLVRHGAGQPAVRASDWWMDS